MELLAKGNFAVAEFGSKNICKKALVFNHYKGLSSYVFYYRNQTLTFLIVSMSSRLNENRTIKFDGINQQWQWPLKTFAF
ncbi:hypothetical protein SAMN05421676_103353 [Salinibacillus kushneri]|uniref:Uncharacterized protein n=1 Tax=Salinibacillus kushneri TaxID=237682 RepID=A0A1I0D0J0_9BACI|nr:hypothetical protein SAMN05421676_103353 [Salinibacillus kushneri]